MCNAIARRGGMSLPVAVVSVVLVASLVSVVGAVPPAQISGAQAKLHPTLLQRLSGEPGPAKAWVFFADKGVHTPGERAAAISDVAQKYNTRAKQRRALRASPAVHESGLFAEFDLPLVPAYVDAVARTGAKLHVKSRWVNAVSVWATREQGERIAALPFVRSLQPVARARRVDVLNAQEVAPLPLLDGQDQGGRGMDYGLSAAQLAQINLINLHNEGFTGDGIIVGILDTGFHRGHVAFNNPAHPLNVIAEYDFVDNDGNAGIDPGDASDQHDHGTMILGCLGAYMPGSLVGGAYDASFVLCKTEDKGGEYPAEEDNYVAGLEFIEQHGADMSTASLGYIDWYTQADLDGLTAVTTIAINISTSLGIHHCNAAGNEYHDSNPSTSSLIAPADGFDVITCGAVDSSGTIAYFSSEGPTADGRVKPELLARGVSTHTVSAYSDTSYTTADGTSLSTPVVACAVACLIEARPHWTVSQMRENLIETASYYVTHGTHDPLYVLGYGILDAYNAAHNCTDAGVVLLGRAKYACESNVQITVIDCGLNTDDGVVETVTVAVDSDSEAGVEQLVLTETDASSAEFSASLPISETDAAGTLLVVHGDIITATYVDADDGQGGSGIVVTATAIVDCIAPLISNIRAEDVAPRSATIAFEADEPVRGIVHYGTSCGSLTEVATGGSYSTAPTVALGGLQDDETYYYAVAAEDEAGNTVYDDNGGNCYNFTTPEVPDYFTEEFVSGNDLDNLTLLFSPVGGFEFYRGCTEPISELPIDPAGGTPISLSDDDAVLVSLSGGAEVSLYGVSYGSFYVGSNGYVTFGQSDTDYTESLDEHFAIPRVAALYDDLNPSSGGSVSWKQLADRAVVTYQNVPEYSETTTNTFQIELHFDGAIRVSYLALAADDGLAGLSAGNSLPDGFYATDLSTMSGCDPIPPAARPVAVETEANMPVTITLNATDDGRPEPPQLTFIITSLPAHGELSDPGAGAIDAVPYELVAAGDQVVYTPELWHMDGDSFSFKANDGGVPPEGGDSNEALVTITIVPPAPTLVYSEPLGADPGWATEGQWAFGEPAGWGSHNADPDSGYTGSNVYGYNLLGDYANNLAAPLCLTTTAFDCSGVLNTQLRFRRWLGVERSPFDAVTVDVSADGIDWVTLWFNPAGGSISDSSWAEVSFDLSAVADDEPTVYVRWCLGPTDAGTTYPGWNIDDIEIWGNDTNPQIVGDLDGDCDVDLADLQALLAHYGQGGAGYGEGDLDGNGQVDLADLQLLLANYGLVCQ